MAKRGQRRNNTVRDAYEGLRAVAARIRYGEEHAKGWLWLARTTHWSEAVLDFRRALRRAWRRR